ELARAASKPKYEVTDIDLQMDGALGPETHVYGQMALHLYMRDSGPASDSSSGSSGDSDH
ncbi:MAG: hypothetical protein ACWA5W_02820, partial [Phycisphaerales bacterium]